MRRRLLGYVVCLVLTFLLVPALNLAAEDSSGPPGVRVGVMLDSSKARIQNLLPELRERARKIATDKKRNIVAVVLIATDEPALRQAKAANCDYLLQMSVDLVNEVSFGPGSSGPDVTHTGMERAVDGRIVVKYHLQSLKDDNVLADDRHTIEDQEYPLDPNASAFQTVISRAVESATAACMSKLKKKI
jgi:hypothetical protein